MVVSAGPLLMTQFRYGRLDKSSDVTGSFRTSFIVELSVRGKKQENCLNSFFNSFRLQIFRKEYNFEFRQCSSCLGGTCYVILRHPTNKYFFVVCVICFIHL